MKGLSVIFLAERTGLEPATLGVTGRYSNQLNYRSKLLRVILKKLFTATRKTGVPRGIRTPVLTVKGWCPRPLDDGDLDYYSYYYFKCLVEISGIEPLTSCMPCKRSPSWAIPPKSRNKTTRHSKQSKILAYFCASAQIAYPATLESLFIASSLPKITRTESIAGVWVVANNA